MEETKMQETGTSNPTMQAPRIEASHGQMSMYPVHGKGKRGRKKKKRRFKKMKLSIQPASALSPQTIKSRSKLSWEPMTWDRISHSILDGFSMSCKMSQILPIKLVSEKLSTIPSNEINIPNSTSDLKTLSIKDEVTIQMLTLATTITATKEQVEKEEETHTIKKLANVAGHLLGSIVDYVVINGKSAVINTSTVTGNDTRHPLIINGVAKLIQGDGNKMGAGLINDNPPSHTHLEVNMIDTTRLWGEETFAVVSKAFSELRGSGLGSNVLLSYNSKFCFLSHPDIHGNIHKPIPNSLSTPAHSIKGLMDWGVECTSAMPKLRGLVMSLAGDPITLVLGDLPQVRYLKEDDDGNHQFQCRLMFQCPRSRIDNLIVLEFNEAP
ncbi:MAG TPA: hypothetical protein PKE06_04115 [Flavilitoribacter sp.]|nr:hypothetical protein [Flavilitoribacter sp.]HMQ87129.1 hypothetical protein [Flavilitoribacter sp.]